MVRKRKKQEETKPWCFYCDREFNDENDLILHQKNKHFRCLTCHKRLVSAKALSVHSLQVHKITVRVIPDAKEGRDEPTWEIFGSQGIPPGMKRGQDPPKQGAAVMSEMLPPPGMPLPYAPGGLPPPPYGNAPYYPHHRPPPMASMPHYHGKPPPMGPPIPGRGPPLPPYPRGLPPGPYPPGPPPPHGYARPPPPHMLPPHPPHQHPHHLHRPPYPPYPGPPMQGHMPPPRPGYPLIMHPPPGGALQPHPVLPPPAGPPPPSQGEQGNGAAAPPREVATAPPGPVHCGDGVELVWAEEELSMEERRASLPKYSSSSPLKKLPDTDTTVS